MRKNRLVVRSCFLGLFCLANAAQAATSPAAPAPLTIYDKDNITATIGGFAEFDAISDSTRGLSESLGSAAVARPNTINGSGGQMFFSARNSRLNLSVMDKQNEKFNTKAFIELDFMGYDPAPTSTGGSTEASYIQNPTARIRQSYVQASNKDGWSILAGQAWSLFGWQPYYQTTTVDTGPVTGVLSERTPEILAIKTFGDTKDMAVQVGAAISRPAQKTSQVPNIDGGARFVLGQYQGQLSSFTSPNKMVPLSVGVSSTFRSFVTPNATKTEQSRHSGYAYAVDAQVPVLAFVGFNKSNEHSLVLTTEYSKGRGYGDQFPSWTGGLTTFTGSSVTANGSTLNTTYLDAGLGGYNSSNSFSLVELQSWNVAMQYQHGPCYFSSGYSTLTSSNSNSLTVSNTGTTIANSALYAQTNNVYVNMMHDFGRARIGLEYDFYRTHYADNVAANNNRLQLSTLVFL